MRETMLEGRIRRQRMLDKMQGLRKHAMLAQI